MTASHERLIADVLSDLRRRAVLGPRWEQKFRTEATEFFLEAMESHTDRLEAELGSWALSLWRDYTTLAKAEEQHAKELKEAPSRARRKRMKGLWASPRNRPDAAALRQAVEARRIDVVYHWTEAENLESILVHGLRSRHGLRALGIEPKTNSYGSALREAELASYVGIMLRPHEGMIRRAEDPIVLELEPATLAIEGALFVAVRCWPPARVALCPVHS